MAFRTEDDHDRMAPSSSRLARSSYSVVMPGLDPGIHPLRKSPAKWMDCRERRQVYVVCARQTTMPGNDGWRPPSVHRINLERFSTCPRRFRLVSCCFQG